MKISLSYILVLPGEYKWQRIPKKRRIPLTSHPAQVLCQWAHKQYGYPVSTIRKMQEAGCLYCINGKVQERI